MRDGELCRPERAGAPSQAWYVGGGGGNSAALIKQSSLRVYYHLVTLFPIIVDEM